MEYSNTKITTEDVKQWIASFTKASIVINSLECLQDEIKDFLIGRLHESLFLVAYVESQLGIDVNDEVYDRARKLQRELYQKKG